MNADNKISKLLKNIKNIFIALLVALLIRYVFYQPFRIPSKSMLPNLLVGDHLLASRWSPTKRFGNIDLEGILNGW